MTDSTLLPGVRPKGASFQVRVRFPGGGRYSETLPTALEANLRVLELKKLRDAGVLAPIVAEMPSEPTLAAADTIGRR